MIVADRVKETTTTTGTGTVDLAGPSTGFQGFVAGIGGGNACQYCIAAGSEWEVGIGVVTDASPDTLSRVTVLASSNAGALVNFSAGTKDVFVTIPAKRIMPFPYSMPAAPTVYDDEFCEAGLNARWTTVTSPDGTFTVTPDYNNSFLLMKSLGHATQSLHLIRQAIGAEGNAGTVFTLTTRLLLTSYAGTEFMDLTIGDNSTFLGGNFLDLALSESAAAFKGQAYDGSVIVDESLGKFMGELWVHYQRSAANVCKLYFSHNGIQWRRVNSATRTWDIDYLFVRQFGSTSAGEASEHLIDFVRINDPRFFQQV